MVGRFTTLAFGEPPVAFGEPVPFEEGDLEEAASPLF